MFYFVLAKARYILLFNILFIILNTERLSIIFSFFCFWYTVQLIKQKHDLGRHEMEYNVYIITIPTNSFDFV